MLFFKKKEPVEAVNLGWLRADLHSHLLPGIDDGAPDVESSLQMIKGLLHLGYKKIVTTPHVLWEIYPNTSDIITQKVGEVNAALAAEGLSFEITAAAEYFMDEHFQQELNKKSPLLCIKDNLVLVEFSMITAPLDFQTILFEMQMQGYQPLLAHPERYTYMNGRRSQFEDLKFAGCLFQLNLLSLTGYYGKSVQSLAEYLIDNNFYDYAGTDMHHGRHLETLQKLSTSPYYKKLMDAGLKNKFL
jgi:tyrosine-protein phosphatase YwqE